MDLTSVLFWIVALLTVLSAVSVVVTQNIVRAAAWLLFTLAGTAGLFFLLGADFVGSTQLIVYVGGTLVLVVFGVMLTAQGPFISMKTSAAEWGIATIVGLVFLGVLVVAIISLRPWPTGMPSPTATPANSLSGIALGQSLLGINEATPKAQLTGLTSATAESKAPERTRLSYLLPFEIVSVHLLVVLIGAAYLARAKRRTRGQPSPGVASPGL
jgi:NADH-quinone oxidoreductase subunit J